MNILLGFTLNTHLARLHSRAQQLPAANHRPSPTPPSVAYPPGPRDALLLELITANGYPFKDHWSYFVRSRRHPDVGVVKRSFDLGKPDNRPSKAHPAAVADAAAAPHLDEQAMLNHGELKFDTVPVGALEERKPVQGRGAGQDAEGGGRRGAGGKEDYAEELSVVDH
ncbi:hypothetical protein MY11210_002912 [Beauveria gryllotalpidicola]